MPTNNIPIVVTTPTAGVVFGNCSIAIIYWFNPANIGDLVTLQDDAGNLLWPGRCETANQSQVFKVPDPFRVAGYNVPTISSGTLLLYRV